MRWGAKKIRPQNVWLVFGGYEYYASGGPRDFLAAFSDESEARSYAQTALQERRSGWHAADEYWVEVVNLKQMLYSSPDSKL